jgi:2'-5' RNA ligase
MVRCFIGFLIPKEPREKIRQTINELKKLPIECKFVEEENLHLCFSFLGEIEDDQIKNISDSIDSVASSYSSFEVKIHGLKAIPNEKYIRVLALDVSDGMLIRMIKHIQEEAGGDAKPPHLTLCRVRFIGNRQAVVEKIKELQKKEITSFNISSIQLIKSELRRTGPVYSVVYESKFKLE